MRDIYGQATMRALRCAERLGTAYGFRHLWISPLVLVLGVLGFVIAIILAGAP